MADLVSEHETYIQQQKGSLGTIKWLLGFVSFGVIVLILKAFLK